MVEARGVEEAPPVDWFDGRLYLVGDRLLPSVTTVLSKTSDRTALDAWRASVGDERADEVTRIASVHGTAMHSLVEAHLRGEEHEPTNPYTDRVFRACRPILDRVGRVALIEAPLACTSLGVAGRVDLVADFDGVTSVVDHKTSRRPKDEGEFEDYFVQTEAYAEVLRRSYGWGVDQLVVIFYGDDGSVAFKRAVGGKRGEVMGRLRRFYSENGRVLRAARGLPSC